MQAASNETILSARGWLTPLVIKFRLGGSLRFLSHAETLKLFQRACARADIQIQHTQGFNPHPKLSLPLPRPVGVESDDELLSLRCSIPNDRCDLVKNALSEQLPEGIELLSVSNAEPNTSFQPSSTTYILKIHPEHLNEQLKATVSRLLASEKVNIQRQMGPSDSKFKNLDVRPFLKSIVLDNNSIIVQCAISPVGSIRVDEILELLEIKAEMLAAPIKRTNVKWEKEGSPR